MLTNGLVALLLASTPVTSIVGNSIQPIPAPVDLKQFPLVTYQQVSDTLGYTLTGSEGLSTARFVFDCLAPLNPGGYLVARNLALAVKAALSAFSGTLSEGTKVWFIEIANFTENFDNASFLSRSSVHALITYSDI
jgi:hypothetical protein